MRSFDACSRGADPQGSRSAHLLQPSGPAAELGGRGPCGHRGLRRTAAGAAGGVRRPPLARPELT